MLTNQILSAQMPQWLMTALEPLLLSASVSIPLEKQNNLKGVE